MAITARTPRTVEIIGGGLAGLGLGLGLRQRGIPVCIHEAGRYPRHRVCGEFITSLDPATVENLQLAPFLRDARPASSVTWLAQERTILRHTLPEPALCLSRHRLDHSMAQRFVEAGGELRTGSRAAEEEARPGLVWAAGRRGDTSSPWVGMKQHVRDISLQNDLEVHLGRRAYVGLTRVDDQTVNVCGLFHRGRGPAARTLVAQLERSGLHGLSRRIASAQPVPESFCAVAGLAYGRQTEERGPLRLGDSFAMIPPFTGHGMTVAWQGAAAALPSLQAWAEGDGDWSQAVGRARRAVGQRVGARCSRGRMLHAWLLHPQTPLMARLLDRAGIFPSSLLCRLLH
ncbi:MAG: hypothetical protein JHC52_03355 [Chthoniobacterales bacterium]|nr:hypothetical protein [Chthoniobacterales bacterium]